MSVKRSICRTNLPQKNPKASEFARAFPKSSKRILFVLFLITVGGGRRGLSTLAHRRNTVDCQVVTVPTFPISAAFIGTWAIGSEFADNFHRTDLLSMGDLRLTPEGTGF
jgi:hypothetical protein